MTRNNEAKKVIAHVMHDEKKVQMHTVCYTVNASVFFSCYLSHLDMIGFGISTVIIVIQEFADRKLF